MAQAISQQGQLCYTRSVLCDQHKTDYTGTAILCQAVHRATSAKSNIREEKISVNKNITYALPAPPPGCLPGRAQRPHGMHSQQRTHCIPQLHPFPPKKKNPCCVRSEPEQLTQQGFQGTVHAVHTVRRGMKTSHARRTLHKHEKLVNKKESGAPMAPLPPHGDKQTET